jgi:hypothetical protein
MVIDWERTALPVLRALSESDDRNISDGFLFLGYGRHGAPDLGVDIEDGELHDAVLALADVGYVSVRDLEYDSGGGATFMGLRVTGAGMQALGQWPRLQVAMSPVTLLAVLERLQEYAPDAAARADLEKAKDSAKGAAGSALKEAVASFTAQAIKAKFGLG